MRLCKSFLALILIAAICQAAVKKANPKTNQKTGKITANYINGHCLVKESVGSPYKPCNQLIMVLSNRKGLTLQSVPTANDGTFQFVANETDGRYRIACFMKGYEVLSPKGLVRPGDKVEVRLIKR